MIKQHRNELLREAFDALEGPSNSLSRAATMMFKLAAETKKFEASVPEPTRVVFDFGAGETVIWHNAHAQGLFRMLLAKLHAAALQFQKGPTPNLESRHQFESLIDLAEFTTGAENLFHLRVSNSTEVQTFHFEKFD